MGNSIFGPAPLADLQNLPHATYGNNHYVYQTLRDLAKALNAHVASEDQANAAQPRVETFIVVAKTLMLFLNPEGAKEEIDNVLRAYIQVFLPEVAPKLKPRSFRSPVVSGLTTGMLNTETITAEKEHALGVYQETALQHWDTHHSPGSLHTFVEKMFKYIDHVLKTDVKTAHVDVKDWIEEQSQSAQMAMNAAAFLTLELSNTDTDTIDDFRNTTLGLVVHVVNGRTVDSLATFVAPTAAHFTTAVASPPIVTGVVESKANDDDDSDDDALPLVDEVAPVVLHDRLDKALYVWQELPLLKPFWGVLLTMASKCETAKKVVSTKEILVHLIKAADAQIINMHDEAIAQIREAANATEIDIGSDITNPMQAMQVFVQNVAMVCGQIELLYHVPEFGLSLPPSKEVVKMYGIVGKLRSQLREREEFQNDLQTEVETLKQHIKKMEKRAKISRLDRNQLRESVRFETSESIKLEKKSDALEADINKLQQNLHAAKAYSHTLQVQFEALKDAKADGISTLVQTIAASLEQTLSLPSGSDGIIDVLKSIKDLCTTHVATMEHMVQHQRSVSPDTPQNIATVAILTTDIETTHTLSKLTDVAIKSALANRTRHLMAHADQLAASQEALEKLAMRKEEDDAHRMTNVRKLQQGREAARVETAKMIRSVFQDLMVIVAEKHDTVIVAKKVPVLKAVKCLETQLDHANLSKAIIQLYEFLKNNALVVMVKDHSPSALEISQHLFNVLIEDYSMLLQLSRYLEEYNAAIENNVQAKMETLYGKHESKPQPPPRAPPPRAPVEDGSSVVQVTRSGKQLFKSLKNFVSDDKMKEQVEYFLNLSPDAQKALPPTEDQAAVSLVRSAFLEMLAAFELHVIESWPATAVRTKVILALTALQSTLQYSWHHLWDFPATSKAHTETVLLGLAQATSG